MNDTLQFQPQAFPLSTAPLGVTRVRKIIGRICMAEGAWVAKYVMARTKAGRTSEKTVDRLIDRARDEQGRRAANLSASVAVIRLGY